MHVYVCFLASMLYVHVCLFRSRLCHALCLLWACAFQSLRPLAMCGCICPFYELFGGVTTCEAHLRGVGVLDTHLSLLRAMLLCLSCLLCATHLAFFFSLHLCMLVYMFMHEFVCRPHSNPMELWTPNPNLHLSSQDTLFCLITCLFAPVWLSFFDSFSFSMLSLCLFLCLSTGLFLLLLHVHVWSMDTWSKGVTS